METERGKLEGQRFEYVQLQLPPSHFMLIHGAKWFGLRSNYFGQYNSAKKITEQDLAY